MACVGVSTRSAPSLRHWGPPPTSLPADEWVSPRLDSKQSLSSLQCEQTETQQAQPRSCRVNYFLAALRIQELPADLKQPGQQTCETAPARAMRRRPRPSRLGRPTGCRLSFAALRLCRLCQPVASMYVLDWRTTQQMAHGHDRPQPLAVTVSGPDWTPQPLRTGQSCGFCASLLALPCRLAAAFAQHSPR